MNKVVLLLIMGIALVTGCSDSRKVIDTTDSRTYAASFGVILESLNATERLKFATAVTRIMEGEKARLLQEKKIPVIEMEAASRKILHGKNATAIIELSERYPELPVPDFARQQQRRQEPNK